MARYDRDRLYENVWSAPLKIVAEKLGIAPETVAKVCKQLRIPLPDKGHWNKLATGKAVSVRPPLKAVHFVSKNSAESQRGSGKNPGYGSGRLMERYNREELYEDVWKYSFPQLDSKWGTKADTLSHICKALRIPVPGVGYWNKVAAGKPVPLRSPLPPVSVDPRFLTRECSCAGRLCRLIRPADALPLTTVRFLAYSLPVIEEVLDMEVGEDYFRYARQKLKRLRPS